MISFDDQMTAILNELAAFQMPTRADPAEVPIVRNYVLVEQRWNFAE